MLYPGSVVPLAMFIFFFVQNSDISIELYSMFKTYYIPNIFCQVPVWHPILRNGKNLTDNELFLWVESGWCQNLSQSKILLWGQMEFLRCGWCEDEENLKQNKKKHFFCENHNMCTFIKKLQNMPFEDELFENVDVWGHRTCDKPRVVSACFRSKRLSSKEQTENSEKVLECEGNSGEFVELVPEQLNYLGPRDLTQYFIRSKMRWI